ncbi:ribosome maturation protein [Penicillium nucicola]|uniref:ribosome maturation protein n=1 Tax=Penicillium nucicola TaxID=1850975 RepID=UPI0025458A85|nr:ribosome maturation protein [Penicillium nucicola]XP_056989867.1 ribosome maturation protein [Penicillium nucicola]KAJ5771457.1 ribosome maturation protein [Penicillium nucicola]KAJ5776698.1 ribosome maturation protein [Penicillium nucicola]
MATGNTRQSKVFYKGRSEDFVIFVADVNAMDKWRKDRSIPLAQVMDGWKCTGLGEGINTGPES